MSKTLGLQLIDACRAGDLDKVKEFVNQGVNPQNEVCVQDTSRVSRYEHPMFAAIQSKSFELVRYLVEECKVNLFQCKVRDVQDGRRHTRISEYDAICSAIARDEYEEGEVDEVMLELLIRKAKVAGHLDTPAATYYFSSEFREEYDNKQHWQSYQHNLADMTYLIYAAFQKNETAIRLLLRYGANPDLTTKRYRSNNTGNGKRAVDLYPNIQRIIDKADQIESFGEKLLNSKSTYDITIN
jgi:hypothetical protein